MSSLVSSTGIVALVGRPNVGKSALFNRLLGRRSSIVEPTPGVTRDRIYAPVEWQNRRFVIVDTGGIETGAQADLTAQARAQAETAIGEADVIAFVVDARDGIMPGDQDVADLLRPHKQKVVLVANKADSPRTAASIYEFCALGFGEPLPVSAIHGLQSGDLLDAIVAKLPAQPAAGSSPGDANTIRLAIVGQPNVGKSSLVNALLGARRAVVSDSPGTTRDSTDTATSSGGRHFILIDTAGIRRHVRRGGALEYYSSLRAIAALGRCDVALLLVDATAGASVQDKRIAGLAIEEGKALAVMVNKWDLNDAATFSREDAEEALGAQFAFAPYVPVIFGSALTRKGIHKIWDLTAALAAERLKRVATAPLNEVVRGAFLLRPPAVQRGNTLKCYYATQADVAPPTIVFFVNDPRLLHFSYERYLENAIRDAFGFQGTPIRLVFRPRVQQDRITHDDLIAETGQRERAV